MFKTDISNKILFSIFTFFLVFAFPIIPVLNASRFVLLFVIFLFILFPTRGNIIPLNRFDISLFFILLSIILLFTLFQTLVFRQLEFSLFSKVMNAGILIIISYTFFFYADKHIEIDKTIIICFVVQSILILLFIGNQSFYDLTSMFRAEVQENHIAAYGRLRGGAISGYQFFGISTMFGFVILYLILHLKFFKYAFPVLLLICVVGVVQGRYTIVAIGLGSFFFFLELIKKKQIWKVFRYILIICLVCSVLLILLFKTAESIKDPVMRKVIENYLLQPIESVFETGELQTSSTDSLREMYHSEEIKQYFMLGSGRYMNSDGSYFGHIDIGYYRIMGYYGIIGTVLIFFCLVFFIYFTGSKLDMLTKHAFFLYFLLLNLKGDVHIYSNNVIPILVAFLFFSGDKGFSNTLDKNVRKKKLKNILYHKI